MEKHSGNEAKLLVPGIIAGAHKKNIIFEMYLFVTLYFSAG